MFFWPFYYVDNRGLYPVSAKFIVKKKVKKSQPLSSLSVSLCHSVSVTGNGFLKFQEVLLPVAVPQWQCLVEIST